MLLEALLANSYFLRIVKRRCWVVLLESFGVVIDRRRHWLLRMVLEYIRDRDTIGSLRRHCWLLLSVAGSYRRYFLAWRMFELILFHQLRFFANLSAQTPQAVTCWKGFESRKSIATSMTIQWWIYSWSNLIDAVACVAQEMQIAIYPKHASDRTLAFSLIRVWSFGGYV